MSWVNNAPIRFQLGTIALWNMIANRRVVNGDDPAMKLIQNAAPKQFDDLISAPLPVTMEKQ